MHIRIFKVSYNRRMQGKLLLAFITKRSQCPLPLVNAPGMTLRRPLPFARSAHALPLHRHAGNWLSDAPPTLLQSKSLFAVIFSL